MGSGRLVSYSHGVERDTDESRLKLYIFDYLVKNNFGQLAAQFNAEARLENQGAPVNVPEGGALQE